MLTKIFSGTGLIVAVALYALLLLIYTMGRMNGVDLFWWIAPVALGLYVGAVWHFSKQR